MCLKPALFASAIGLALVAAQLAQGEVIYTVFNPARDFTLLVYPSPDFITTDTSIGAAQLTVNPESISTVDFIVSSLTEPGNSEINVSFEPSTGMAEQFRYLPEGDLGTVGTYQFNSSSFGYPNSFLDVAVPEPCSIAIMGAALFAFIGFRRRT